MIAEATIREALDTNREVSVMVRSDGLVYFVQPPDAGSLFEACVEAVDESWGFNALDDPPASSVMARAVIQTIIDRTPSPPHGGRADAHSGGWVVRRLFAACVAAVFCHAVTSDSVLSVLVFMSVVAAIGSARKAE